MSWLIWASFLYCNKENKRDRRTKSARFFNSKYLFFIIKRPVASCFIGNLTGNTSWLLCNEQMVAKLCVPHRSSLVDVWGRCFYCCDHCIIDGRFPGHKGGTC